MFIIDLFGAIKWGIITVYQTIFPETSNLEHPQEESEESEDGWVYMTLDESKKKSKEIKEGVQLLKDVLSVVDKPVDFGDFYKPYKRKTGNGEYPSHIYGITEPRFLHPNVRRLEPNEIKEMEFDDAINDEEEENENT